MRNWLDAERRSEIERLFVSGGTAGVPIHLLRQDEGSGGESTFTAQQKAWLTANGFDANTAKKQLGIPATDGSLAAIALAAGNCAAGEPCGPSELLIGQIAQSCQPGVYQLGGTWPRADLAAVGWGLGAYRFSRYKSSSSAKEAARLATPANVDAGSIASIVEAVWFGRDLINTPASDLGPGELAAAAQGLATRHGAGLAIIEGEALRSGFPMIHAVGRASVRQPCLIDLTWSKPGGRSDAPRITLVGKGICFDTGGLDIKPSSGMLLMKKDMGGAAAALAVAHMIMAHGLDVRLRLLVPAAENAISGDAFRPSDVLTSRAGITVEVGNTDAEGRLVLADALSLADEETPDLLLSFATLTGAARVALGPDLPALFTDDENLAQRLAATGVAIGDPVWRLPLWRGYDRNLDSEVADMGNVSDGPFAGAITAALFLNRFVKKAHRFAHFDLYGWRPVPRALGPKGGEAQTARTVFAVLQDELAAGGAT